MSDRLPTQEEVERRYVLLRPTPEQRAEMAAYVDEQEPGLLDALGIQREKES